MKKIISKISGIKENEVCVAVYTGISLLLLMLVAATENILLIIIAVINLWIAVRQLNKMEKKRVP